MSDRKVCDGCGADVAGGIGWLSVHVGYVSPAEGPMPRWRGKKPDDLDFCTYNCMLMWVVQERETQ